MKVLSLQLMTKLQNLHFFLLSAFSQHPIFLSQVPVWITSGLMYNIH